MASSERHTQKVAGPPKELASAFSLAGETALITGGATGLGFGMARCFVMAGATVVIVGRRESELQRAVRELGDGRAHYVVHDVTSTDKAGSLVSVAAEKAEASISILVNNAGVHLKKPAVETSVAEFSSVLQTHVLAAHALTSAVLPEMQQRRHGVVLFTASMASLFGIPRLVAYAAAKSAYLGMVRTLAAEVSPDGVRVNAIAPGWIDSAMMRTALAGDPARSARILGRTPLSRFGDADDIGWAATYLASPAGQFVTGVVLPVDGGVSIGF